MEKKQVFDAEKRVYQTPSCMEYTVGTHKVICTSGVYESTEHVNDYVDEEGW